MSERPLDPRGSVQGQTQLDESVLITAFWTEKDQSAATEQTDVKESSCGDPTLAPLRLLTSLLCFFFPQLLIHSLLK